MSGACFAGRGAGHAMPKLGWCLAVVLSWLLMTAECLCQESVFQPSAEQLAKAGQQLQLLRTELEGLRDRPELLTTQGRQLLADVQVFEKAAAWMLRFSEFPKEPWVGQLQRVLSEGRRRAGRLLEGAPDWNLRLGTTIRGYVSAVDGSVQPYALTLPEGVDPVTAKRWPVHVVLHGRADQMNEVNFIERMDGRGPGASRNERPGQWLQLDVYGRGNNAYRWAGETDVFEALADLKTRFRVDENRVVLHGFSMGGAGAWHLGLHHPDQWCSVGAGAGFVDFYQYQKKDPVTDRLPWAQHLTLGIYDAVDYALNAANVPVVTYGGERDPQLLASTTMQKRTGELQVPLQVLIGAGMGHEFDADSRRKFMDFHLERSLVGRPQYGQRKKLRFSTRTLRYSRCDWLRIEEQLVSYQPSTAEGEIDELDTLRLTTRNVALLRLSREIAGTVVIDGSELELRGAAEGLLPDVWFRRESDDSWTVLGYQESRAISRNPEVRRRPGLQGPIDDAFMGSFLCVQGTGVPLHPAAGEWSQAVLQNFREEFAKWFRGDVRVVTDQELTEQMIAEHHLILFGDPGSNSVLARVLPQLHGQPVEWNAERIRVGQREWSAAEHGLVLIHPNPLNRSKYVVLNSGHTFHERDFRASNAWLFPRLGDAAVLRLSGAAGNAESAIQWSGIFDSGWKLLTE
ncbi:MAG: alpha/beta hydrolase-fold protein [Planctomyces sp.]